jgi:imidazolonepropionase
MTTPGPPVTITGATIATMTDTPGAVAGEADSAYGIIHDAAMVVDAGKVAWVGPQADLPAQWRQAEPRDAGGALITPGLVECHAQVLFGGDGRNEFRAGQHGAEGAGAQRIHQIAAATRAAGDSELLAAATRRAWWFIRQGVTTLEVKTGYGLDTGGELRLLRLAGQLRAALPIHVRVTLLAGHTYPPGADPEDYVIGVCDELLPAAIAHGGFDAVEVYCEETAGITMEDASTILETVYRKKIPTRVAADHLSDSAGGALAPAFYAKAAAHLDFTDEIAVKAMGRAGTVAILVPGSALELGPADHRPPVPLLRENHVPLAVSTGCNPGATPLTDLRAAAHLATSLYGLSEPEALRGITSAAARALGLTGGAGSLAAGGSADFVIWDADHPAELVYWLGAPTCREVWAAGSEVWAAGRKVTSSGASP